jgi:transposase-like protein
MKMKTKRRYTDEFKAQAVELAKLGKPVSEVVKDLEITVDLVYRWRKVRREEAEASEP